MDVGRSSMWKVEGIASDLRRRGGPSSINVLESGIFARRTNE